MFDIQKFKANVNEADNMTFGEREDYEWVERLWQERLSMVIRDDETFKEFISYMRTDMTGIEYVFLSEISDEIAAEKPSIDFIEAYKALAIKYPTETQNYNIDSFIEDAERIVKYCLEEGQNNE